MKHQWLRLGGALAALGLLAVAVGPSYSAFRRVETIFRLVGSSITVQGVVMEKLVEQRADRLLPFDVTTHVVRYAYPNPQGQMRTGEQVVTKGFFEQVRGQGAPVRITYSSTDPAISAIDPRLTFPASAGWRAGVALAALALALIVAAAVIRQR